MMKVADSVVSAEKESPAVQKVRLALSSFGNWVATGPASVWLVGFIALFYVTAQLFPTRGLEAVAAGSFSNWWSVFTAWLAVRSLAQLLLDVALLLSLGVALERLLGSGRYLLVGFFSYWLGAAASLGVVKIVHVFDPAWAALLTSESVVGIAAFLLAAAGAASMKMAPLWRRRVQTLVVTILVMLVLFAGYLGAIVSTLAWIFGLLIGRVIYRRVRRENRGNLVGAGPQDGRVLTALIIGGIVIGDAISLTSVHFTGILATLQQGAVGVGPTLLGNPCVQTELVNCAHYGGSKGFVGLHVLAPLLLQLVFAWGLRRGRRSAYLGTVLLQGAALTLAAINLLIFWKYPEHWSALGFEQSGFSLSRLAASVAVPAVILILAVSSRRLYTVLSGAEVSKKIWERLSAWIVAGWAAAVALAFLITGLGQAGETFLSITKTYFLFLLPSPSLAIDVAPAGGAGALLAAQSATYIALLPWLGAILIFVHTSRQQVLPASITRERFIELTEKFGGGSLGWMSTWDGNHYWESSGADGAVAYRLGGGVALTVTDPVAAPGRLGSVMEEFVTFAVRQGLVPAFYSIHQPVEDFAKSWGWPSLQVAQESLIDLPELSFTGKKFQAVRTSLNRAKKEGIVARWVKYADCPEEWKQQIKDISSRWVGDKPLPEMGFTLGGLAELDDPQVGLLLAVDEAGTIHGVTSWLPIYETGEIVGWTLDFMRRLDGGFRPVMEFLIASAALRAKEEGYQVLSLSGAPLATADDTGADTAPLDSVLTLVGALLEPVYGFRSLLRFKDKFQPRHVPLYLTVPTLGALPSAALAIGNAYLPGLRPTQIADLAKMLVRN